MIGAKTFRHEDYELHCSARAVDSGRFVPILVLSKQAWPRRPREIAMRRGDYLTEETAIDAAHEQGIEWISNFG